jgi:seryl-tRNA synthetase
MFDLKWIRDNPAAFDHAFARRGLGAQSPGVLALDEKRRRAQTELQELQAQRNETSRRVGDAMKRGNKDEAEELKTAVGLMKARMEALEGESAALEAELDTLLSSLPNLPADDVPDGSGEAGNRELKRWGEPRAFTFAPRQHFELGEAAGGLDFELAARLSGARFVVLKGAYARLHRALAQFMLDLHTEEHGYTEVITPVLVRDQALHGTGQLPKFAEDLFQTTAGHWLIPTAEVTLTNFAAERILDDKDLPLRLTAHTLCFRAEAGAAGRDTRGMLRQHQFEKVELVSICHPDRSEAEHQRMTRCAETVLEMLELPYRKVVLCTGDMGFGARKTYDLEVWLPGQNTYREISSCSNCGDFQARRMQGRFKAAGEKGTRFLHTLNGSGVAIGRALIAVLENYQEADGGVRVPKVLQPYLGGLETIAPHA